MRDELKELTEKINEVIDRQFKPIIEMNSSIRQWASESLEINEKIGIYFNDNPNEVASPSSLSLISTMIASSTKRQLATLELQHQIIKELKDAFFTSLYLPFHAYLEMSDAVIPVIADRINTLETVVDIVKEQRSDEINVPERIEKELREWLKEREDMKRAIKQYGV